MATTEFGDEIDVVESVQTTEFGDTVEQIVPRGTFSGFTPEQEVLAQQFISSREQPALSKAITGALGLGKALVQPVVSIGKGLGAIPELAADPLRLLPTVAESGRRVGMDVVSLADMLSKLTGGPSLSGALDPSARPQEFSLLQGIKAGIPGLGLAENIRQGIAGLSPSTPTQAEVQQFVEAAPFGQALAEERQKVAFEGAQPEFAEAVAQVVELAPPIKGAQILKGGINIAKAPISTLVRSAVKPSNAKIGAAVEQAAAKEMDEIFTRNPNADTIGTTPIQGVATEVKAAFKETGERLSALRSLSGATLKAGDDLAKKIEAKADALEAAGQPKSLIDEMNVRAAEVRGRMTDLNSLQDAVTIANRKPNILLPKTTGQGFVDEIIAREGGELINKELKAVGGAEGEAIRKKWSNLKHLDESFEARVNKIINDAPAEAQPALLQALASPQGAAGVFALVNGWTLPGAIALGSKIVSTWAKNEVKALKDSNAIITGVYNRMRANPPQVTLPVAAAAPVPTQAAGVVPPPLPPQQIAQQAITQSILNQFPTRPSQGTPRVLATPRQVYEGLTPAQLNQEMARLANAGRLAEAQQISDYLRSQLGL